MRKFLIIFAGWGGLVYAQGFDSAYMIWNKAGGNLYNTNYQAARGDYSSGFNVKYHTDCRVLDTLLDANSYGQFAVGDINSDGSREVVAVAKDHVCVFRGSDGSVLWAKALLNLSGHVSPLIDDIDNDGLNDIIIINGSRNVLYSQVYALRGSNGSVIWDFPFNMYWSGEEDISSPTAYDLDGDGDKDVLVGSGTDTLYALDGSTGNPIWKFATYGDVRTTPAVSPSILVFASYFAGVYALNHNGGIVWTRFLKFGGYIWASPVMVDINGLGNPDVIVATLGGLIYALDGDNGSTLWSYTTLGAIRSTPSVADVDNDGFKEVIAGDLGGNVYILDISTGSLENSFALMPREPIHPYWAITTADISPLTTGLEIVIATESVFRSGPNKLYVYSHTGTLLFYADTVGDGATLADVDNDRCLEIISEKEDTLPSTPGTAYIVYDSPKNSGGNCAPIGTYEAPKNTNDTQKEIELYDVSGRKVKGRLNRGIYFLKYRNKANKVIIK